MKKPLTPKLYLRSDKKDSEGTMPLFVRFRRIEGKEPKFSMGYRFSLNEWDSQNNLPKDEFARGVIEQEIQRIKREILLCYVNGINVDYQKLQRIVKNENLNPQNDLFLDYFKEYMDKKDKHNCFRTPTMRGYFYTLNALEKFNKNLKIKDVNELTINKFIKFLQSRKKDKSKQYAFRRQLVQIRSVIRYISQRNIPIDNPFDKGDILIPQCGRNTTYLNKNEILKLYRLLKRGNLSDVEYRVLTMFLFACSTGLRISDCRSLYWRNLKFINTIGVLEFTCMKTQRANFVPISPLAGLMLVHACEHNLDNVEKELPMFIKIYSPTTINNTLKKLAMKIGIDKPITFHTARRTFATYCSVNGVPFNIIQSILGHKPANVTERYCQWDLDTAASSVSKLRCFHPKNLRKSA